MHLSQRIENFTKLSKEQKQGLKKLGLHTLEDLLFYIPVRYHDPSKTVSLLSIAPGDVVQVFGTIKNLKTTKSFRTHIPMSKATLYNEEGKIEIVWFNQPYIAKMLKENMSVRVQGKIAQSKNGLSFTNPHIEEVNQIPQIEGQTLFGKDKDTTVLMPVYNETKYITSNWIYHTLQKIFKTHSETKIEDPIPYNILKKYSLPSLWTALVWAHTPRMQEDYEIARKRLAFQEILFIQIQKYIERKKILESPSITIKDAQKLAYEFENRLPFTLTDSQKKAIQTITKEMEKGVALSRLLEGDVGSGKTAVAGATAYAVIKSEPYIGKFGFNQVAYMAPTEILATQHFESFISLFKHLPIEIVLLTGSVCKKFPSKVTKESSTQVSKAQAQKWIKEGKISLVIGTHSLIQKNVVFKNLAYVIIDEQHRFGVTQRQKLARKDGHIPNLLSMTATPIPRTLALTVFGDLDISLLDEMPQGRKPVITEIIAEHKREEMYEKVKKELKDGRQVYIICPRIDEPDKDKERVLQLRSVKAEAKRLKEKVFTQYRIDILHSKMTPKEKESIMTSFYRGEIDILVSTSVVEVGVNVPNATVIIIEGGERFGLSQLHQLRGRVIRGNHQAYCYVISDSKKDVSIDRLRSFRNAKNGFELAELDMMSRGIGMLGGSKQWGVSDVAMEALRNIKMVEIARNEAKNIGDNLNSFPLIKEICHNKKEFHFE